MVTCLVPQLASSLVIVIVGLLLRDLHDNSAYVPIGSDSMALYQAKQLERSVPFPGGVPGGSNITYTYTRKHLLANISLLINDVIVFWLTLYVKRAKEIKPRKVRVLLVKRIVELPVSREVSFVSFVPICHVT